MRCRALQVGGKDALALAAGLTKLEVSARSLSEPSESLSVRQRLEFGYFRDPTLFALAMTSLAEAATASAAASGTEAKAAAAAAAPSSGLRGCVFSAPASLLEAAMNLSEDAVPLKPLQALGSRSVAAPCRSASV